MQHDLISSTGNALIKRIRALEQRKRRQEEGAFFVEGIGPVWQAVEHRAKIQALIVAPDLLTSDSARRMVETERQSGTRVVNVSGAVFQSVAQRQNPAGLGAVVEMPLYTLEDVPIAGPAVVVALHEVGNPGNLGTIIRTVDAVGGAGIVLIGDSTDPYHPTAVKASMGTLFAHPLVIVREAKTVLEWQRAHGLQLVTTSAHAPASYWNAPYHLPALFLFGSEGEGLGQDLVSQGDLAVRIPMQGSATSLNLAVSVGVLLYEVRRTCGTGN